VRDFRELFVWQRAHGLTLAIYRATATFPSNELYGLTSQMRRASASIGANIAEGVGKDSHREVLRFFQMASGSGSELDNHLLLARDLGFLQRPLYVELSQDLTELRRMMTSFIRTYGQKHRIEVGR
jgi:four helix bundle protein